MPAPSTPRRDGTDGSSPLVPSGEGTRLVAHRGWRAEKSDSPPWWPTRSSTPSTSRHRAPVELTLALEATACPRSL